MTLRRDETSEPRVKLTLARAALAWERLWPALWPAIAILGLFLALALFNVLPLLEGWLHATLLALFALVFAGALGWGLRKVRLPGEAEARRRLERDSGLAHRPLHAVRDTLAAASKDPATAALWRLHQERMRARLKQLKVRPPHPNLAARDPWAVRAAVFLVLFVASAGTWGDWGPRLSAALTPNVGGGTGAPLPVLDIWVTPPAYTALPPIFLRPPAPDTEPATIQVPVGSTLMARVAGGKSLPHLTANGTDTDFAKVDATTWQASVRLDIGDRIAVRQGGRELGQWPMVVVPDTHPAITFTEPPSPTERSVLKLAYQATDDHGLTQVNATIRLNVGGDVPEGMGREPIELKLPLAGARPKEAKSASFHDFTPHPWAGLPVLVRLSATDGAGQTGVTPDVEITLPERTFNHPIARELVQHRKELTLRGDSGREEVSRAIDETSTQVGAYGGDIVAFMAMRMAAGRLVMDTEAGALPAVQQLLWDTALRIEDGGLSIAERELRDAQQKLAEALDRNAPDAELQKLMDELQQAMDRFMEAMEEQLRQALERGEQPMQVPPQMAQQMMDRNDIQNMLDQMRQMAQTGSKDAARQMLSQLQQMLENMKAGVMAQMRPGDNQAFDMMRELEDMARQQQNLLDQSFRQSQQGQDPGEMTEPPFPMPGSRMPGRQGRQPGGPPQQQPGQAGDPQRSAEQQEALRRQLGELMRRMGETGGEIPRPLGRAERAMRDAGKALGEGDPQMAMPSQNQALQQLQEGLQDFAQQMMDQMGMQAGAMPGNQPMRPGKGRDPLGRRMPNTGQWDDGDVRIPEQSELQRAREIQDELRRRSGEQQRPKLELEYIDRLLRQF
ncbi:MAG TPA: TIGR02302 family protein [Azospirillaceae bacterium]|nr:TIGR02302 family protein [Azospirillaceae bacterium]